MENPVDKTSKKQPSIETAVPLHEREMFFGNFLKKAREKISNPNPKFSGRSIFIKGLVEELKNNGCDTISQKSLETWEAGISLPPEDKLPSLAQVYKVELTKLKEALDVSRNFRVNVASFRRMTRDKKKPKVVDFPTSGGRSRW
jgi:transcriptional regulator with XRE-family HTH domain